MHSVKLYQCSNCQKSYQRHNHYSRHILNCCPSESIDSQTVTIETIQAPSQVSQTLAHLLASNNQLRKEITELKKWQQEKKRKFDIIDWLKQNFQNKHKL